MITATSRQIKGLRALWLVCFPAAVLLVCLSAARHHSSVPAAAGLPVSAAVASPSAATRSYRGQRPRKQHDVLHRSLRQPAGERDTDSGLAQWPSAADSGLSGASAGSAATILAHQQVQAQQAGEVAELLSQSIASGSSGQAAAVSSLGDGPQDPLSASATSGPGQDGADSSLAVNGPASDGSGSGSGSGSDGLSSGKPKLFLFIGILSGRGYRHRRLAVREAWATQAQLPGTLAARFILSDDERTPQVQGENEAHGDVVFVASSETTYKSILEKTYFLFEYAVATYDVAFIMKTDDDAFVNPAWLVVALRNMCVSEGCQQERLYMGRMASNSRVLLRPGHKWANVDFWNHTGLREYPRYAMGGGYVLSADIAATLVDTQTRIGLKFMLEFTLEARVGLKFTPIEDAMVGAWVSAWDVRHVSHRRFWTFAAPCCFANAARKAGQKAAPRFQLQEKMEQNVCSDSPWLVLHKVDAPSKMRYLGQRFAECAQPPGEAWLPAAAAA